MLRRILVRIGVGLATLWAVTALVFLGTEALPGDAATAALGREATPALVQGLRKEFGLDRPLLVRYGKWLDGFLHGDLGRSLPSGDPVTTVIANPVRNTAALALVTLAVLVPLSVGLGIASAVRRNRLLDHGVAGTTPPL